MRRLLATALTTAVLAAGAALAGPAPAASAASGHDRRIVTHVVRAGDTPSGLAVRYHAWTAELIARNHLGGRHLRVGERIEIPVVVSAARKAHRQQHSGGHRGGHVRSLPDLPRAQVRRMIVRQADRAGVDPHLALAVAWQESGWQMDVISSAGAIGPMQVLPSTADWMEQYVGHRLQPRKLRGNAITGTTLLRVLRQHTGSTRHQVAAYYQGLGAVQRHGLYDETRPYVRNVLALRRMLERGQPLG